LKKHEGDYKVDPGRLGLMGASAGGHLACLAAVTATGGNGDSDSTRVKAVAVFFPPTDFVDFGGKALDSRDELFGRLLGDAAKPQAAGEDDGDAARLLKQISPAHLVTRGSPPFLLIHGDADPVVPLQQSERMLAALKAADVPAELIVKKGGGHPWFTIHEEVKVVADWFDTQLGTE
jgi:dipeptidyl aminopeptidase/acylaminoacyl peptidase